MDALIDNPIVFPVLVALVIATFLGIAIAIISRIFAIKEDTRVIELTEILPGANCGACGYPSCAAYAEGMVLKGDDVKTRCSFGGPDTAKEVAAYFGEEADDVVPLIAIVHCQGANYHMQNRYEYNGTMTCAAADTVQRGPGSCNWGCIGYGDCVTVCEYDAIHVIDDLARVDPANCTACGKCIPACPKHLIRFEPKREDIYAVRCANPLSGALTRRNCDIGCIGCGKCEAACQFDAVHVNGSLALIDQDKCTQCGDCWEACPTGSITFQLPLPDTTPEAKEREKAAKEAAEAEAAAEAAAAPTGSTQPAS